MVGNVWGKGLYRQISTEFTQQWSLSLPVLPVNDLYLCIWLIPSLNVFGHVWQTNAQTFVAASAELAWSQLPLPDSSPLVHECCSSCRYITCLQRYKAYLNIFCPLHFSSWTGRKALAPTALSYRALVHTLWLCTGSWESSGPAVCWKAGCTIASVSRMQRIAA